MLTKVAGSTTATADSITWSIEEDAMGCDECDGPADEDVLAAG